MTEEELQRKRQEFKDGETQNKISQLSSAEEFRQQTLKQNYTRKKVKVKIGKFGLGILYGQAFSLVFFTVLFFLSYIPKTKFIITKLLP